MEAYGGKLDELRDTRRAAVANPSLRQHWSHRHKVERLRKDLRELRSDAAEFIGVFRILRRQRRPSA